MKVWRLAGAMLILTWILATTGCGYHTAGHAVQLPENVKTIAVPAFVNETTTYRIEQLLTSSVVREFTMRTHYHILNDPGDAADATLRDLVGRPWRNVGPSRGGRSVAVSGIPGRPLTWFAGYTGGGLWRTDDAGLSWRNISDGQFKSSSIGAIAVACRRHANLHPDAVMHGRPMAIDDYLAAPFLADPLRLLDSCLISDGGAAYVTTSLERARDLPQPPAVVAGVGEGYSGSGAHWSQQRAFTSTPQVFSAPGAFAMAGCTPADVDVCQIYDAFTPMVLLSYEALGFCGKGEGGAFVEDGKMRVGGALPTNTDGGGLSCCHTGMRGMFIMVEAAKQLWGQCGDRQVPNCRFVHYSSDVAGKALSIIYGH